MQLAKTGEETDMRLFKMGKRVGIAQAIVNTAVGITRAFKDLPIWAAIPASVTIAAAGAAQIAAIRAAKPSGSGGGISRPSTAPTFFTGFSNTADMAPSSMGSAQFAASLRSSGGVVQFQIDGRNLVGVLSNNAEASQRTTGRNGVLGQAAPGGNILPPVLEF